MFMTKVKTAVVLLLALGTLTLGAGLFTYSQVAAPQPKDSKGPEGEPAAQAKEKQELPPVQAANRREKVVELMKARVEAARTEVELRTARYRLAVEGASLDQLLAALERLLHAESELVLQRNRGVAFPTGNLRLEQAAVYEAHLKRVKPIEELCQKLLQVQPGIKADLNQVIYYRLQAEILLESTNALLKFGQPAKDNP